MASLFSPSFRSTNVAHLCSSSLRHQRFLFLSTLKHFIFTLRRLYFYHGYHSLLFINEIRTSHSMSASLHAKELLDFFESALYMLKRLTGSKSGLLHVKETQAKVCHRSKSISPAGVLSLVLHPVYISSLDNALYYVTSLSRHPHSYKLSMFYPS